MLPKFEEPDYKSMHTKQLLRLLSNVRSIDPYGGDVDPWYGWSREQKALVMKNAKAELATREHVPNKQEAKAIRQAKHKRGH